MAPAPDMRASYLAYKFIHPQIASLVAVIYEKERFEKHYGKPNNEVLIIKRDDLPLISSYLQRAGLRPDRDYKLFPVFIESEVEQEEIPELIKQFPFSMAYLCEVCNKPMFSGAHKHLLDYCPKCKRETVHKTPFFGYPFHCSECATCARP